MIFATVGTQLPFPRLIDGLNGLAADLGEEIIAQTGPEPGDWPNLDVRPSLAPAEFTDLFTAARVVVAHAGVGTILSAKRFGKPLVLLPRRVALGEHRNDHQMATAKAVEPLPGLHIAWEVEDLSALLQEQDLACATDAPSPSHTALMARLKNFIDES